MTEVETLNAICYWLIKQCTETNAETMTINQKVVNHLGTQLGDWEIIVRRTSLAPDVKK